MYLPHRGAVLAVGDRRGGPFETFGLRTTGAPEVYFVQSLSAGPRLSPFRGGEIKRSIYYAREPYVKSMSNRNNNTSRRRRAGPGGAPGAPPAPPRTRSSPNPDPDPFPQWNPKTRNPNLPSEQAPVRLEPTRKCTFTVSVHLLCFPFIKIRCAFGRRVSTLAKVRSTSG